MMKRSVIFVTLLFCLTLVRVSQVGAAPLRGDFNNDLTVNLADLNLLLPALHTSNTRFALTGIDNGYIDLYDYNELLKVLGTTAPPPVGSPALFVYNQPSLDPSYRGTITSADGSLSKPLQFRTTANLADSNWKTLIVRVAVSSTTTISLTLPEAAQFSQLLSPTQDLPSSFSGNTVNFKLPAGPGVYILKTNDKKPYETIVFWVDDYTKLMLTPPTGATVVKPSDSVQALINAAPVNATLYFPEGVYNSENLLIKNKHGVRFIMHPQAVLNQTAGSGNFIHLQESDGIVFSGPGEISSQPYNKQTTFLIENSGNIQLNDFFLYKQRKDDGWTLHINRSNGVAVNNVRIVSGNDGTDPDSSSNVRYSGVYIESRDDAVAIKTRGEKPAYGIYFSNSFAKSYNSALKIGQASVRQNISDVVFENSTVFDSDRALVVNPDSGEGKIGVVTFKNIRVKNMRNYDNGFTIQVLGTPQNYTGSTQITFDGIDADVLKTNLINQNVLATKVVVQNSKFTVYSKTDLFSSGSCSKLTLRNISVNWVAGGGGLGCSQTQ